MIDWSIVDIFAISDGDDIRILPNSNNNDDDAKYATVSFLSMWPYMALYGPIWVGHIPVPLQLSLA
jgi:hypothetical protein